MCKSELKQDLKALGETLIAWSVVVDNFSDKEIVEIYGRGIDRALVIMNNIKKKVKKCNPKSTT